MERILVTGHSMASEEYYLGYDNWAMLLRKWLDGVSVFNTAISGETSTELAQNIESECKARLPDLIIISIGANDARIQNDKYLTPEEKFEENLKKIIEICKKYTKEIIFLGEIPCDESKTCPTIWSNQEINEYFKIEDLKRYEQILKEICKKENVYFIELFDEWLSNDYLKWLDEEDGLHPNKIGYQKIFERVRDFLAKEKFLC